MNHCLNTLLARSAPSGGAVNLEYHRFCDAAPDWMITVNGGLHLDIKHYRCANYITKSMFQMELMTTNIVKHNHQYNLSI